MAQVYKRCVNLRISNLWCLLFQACETIFCIYRISGIQIWYRFVQQNAAMRARTHFNTHSVSLRFWSNFGSIPSISFLPKYPNLPLNPSIPLSPNPAPKPKSLNPLTHQSIKPSLLSSIPAQAGLRFGFLRLCTIKKCPYMLKSDHRELRNS